MNCYSANIYITISLILHLNVLICVMRTTVVLNSLKGSCVSNCKHLLDGHYQSCETCNGYVTCSNQNCYKRTCPTNLVWDDHAKQCLYNSTTCPSPITTPKTNSEEFFSNQNDSLSSLEIHM